MTPHAPYRCTSAAPRRLARISLVQNDYLLGACSYVIGALSLHRGFALLLFSVGYTDSTHSCVLRRVLVSCLSPVPSRGMGCYEKKLSGSLLPSTSLLTCESGKCSHHSPPGIIAS